MKENIRSEDVTDKKKTATPGMANSGQVKLTSRYQFSRFLAKNTIVKVSGEPANDNEIVGSIDGDSVHIANINNGGGEQSSSPSGESVSAEANGASSGVYSKPSALEAAKNYKARGFCPLPVLPGQKGAKVKDWPDLIIAEEDLPAYFSHQGNISLLLGEASGGLIDIDIDCREAKPFTYFLPDTNMVHGRPGNPTSHYWYRIGGEIPKRQIYKDGDEMLVELRSATGQTLAPPSIHPSGELLEWELDGEPATVSLEDIQQAVSRMAAGAILARHWPKRGSRNITSLALAGILIKKGWEDSDSIKFIDTIAKTARDEKWGERGNAIGSTRKKLEEDGHVTGIPTLKELMGEKAVSQACKWLGVETDTKADICQKVEELNKKHAVVMVGGKTVILNEDYDPVLKWPNVTFSLPKDFKLRYQNKLVITSYDEEKPKYSGLADVWLNHKERRQYEGIVFSPKENHERYFNLFKGFAIEPKEGDCSLYWNHALDVICCGNEEVYLYVRKWMAHAVQKPAELPEVALVLRGRQGTGKNTFVDKFGQLFGQHFITLNNMGQVSGRFNSHLKDKLLVHANEAIWGGEKSSDGILKAMITDKLTPVEPKGIDIFMVQNYKRLIASSNEDWTVPMGHDDRRYLALDVPDIHKEDHDYFKAINKQMESGGYQALMHDLLNEDLSNFNVRKPPKTGFGFDMKLLTMKPWEKWLYHYLLEGDAVPSDLPFDKDNENEENWETMQSTKRVHENYVEWCNNINVRHLDDKGTLTKNLQKVFPDLAIKKLSYSPRERQYVFPSLLAECKELFEKYTNEDSSIWPNDEEMKIDESPTDLDPVDPEQGL